IEAPDVDFVWVDGYELDDGRVVEGFYRERHKPGFRWVDAGYDRNGNWVECDWVPVSRRPGHVWVSGHRGPGGYWVTGHWRPIRRAGYTWVAGRWNGGVYINGYWSPTRSRHNEIWVPGHWTPSGLWVEGFWRPRYRANYRWVGGNWRYGRWNPGYW